VWIYFQHLLSLGIICLTAYLINHLITELEILDTKTFFPAFIYIVIMSGFYSIQNIHPIIFSNLFLVLALIKVMSTHRKDYALADFFAAGILISIATLFYVPSFIFFPFIWVSLIIIRPFIWREWIVSLIGFVIPYLYVFMAYYWQGTTDYLWYDKIFYPISIKTTISEFNYLQLFILAIFVLLVILSGFRTLGGIVQSNTRAKNNIWLIHWFFLLGALSIVVSPNLSVKYFTVLAIPLTVYFANYFLSAKRKNATETFFTFFLLLLLVNYLSDLNIITL
jgi:hypothetical protein